MKITRTQAVAIFEGLGKEDASTWKRGKMQSALEKLCETVGEDEIIGDEDLDNLLDDLIAAGVEKQPIEIVRETEAEEVSEEPDSADEDDASDEAEEVAPEAPEASEEVMEEEPPKPRGRRTKKAEPAEEAESVVEEKPKRGRKKKEAEEKKPAPKAPPKEEVVEVKRVSKRRSVSGKNPQSIRISKGRPYWAGVVLKRHGMHVGITGRMIAELDELMGRGENPSESQARLKAAWHSISGWLAEEEGNA